MRRGEVVKCDELWRVVRLVKRQLKMMVEMTVVIIMNGMFKKKMCCKITTI